MELTASLAMPMFVYALLSADVRALMPWVSLAKRDADSAGTINRTFAPNSTNLFQMRSEAAAMKTFLLVSKTRHTPTMQVMCRSNSDVPERRASRDSRILPIASSFIIFPLDST